VNPDVVDLYTIDKNMKTPRKAQKDNPAENQKNTIKFKCQLKGAQFLHLACQGGGSPLAPRQLRHCWCRNI